MTHFVEACGEEGRLIREGSDKAALIALAEQAHCKALP